ncbi:MAG: zinc-dependent alcohol dehydrogenase family protein [Flavobacteriaceae bacterium]
MKAAYYNSFKGDISIEILPDPEPTSSGVVIQLEASGLCLSDWHGWQGHDADIKLPHVPGHELAGIVVEIGNHVENFKLGDRVTVPFVGGCGQCRYCQSGNPQVCDHQFQPGFTAWGSFAEYVSIEYADINLVHLPPEIDSVSAASLGCRFATAYRAVKDQGQLQDNQVLAVYGCGGVGLSCIQIGKALGARVIAIDINKAKCDLAHELGAHHTINGSNTKAAKEVRDLSHGGADVSIDALGHTETFLNSLHSLKKGGKHIQVGLMTEEHAHAAVPMSMIISNELEIIGSHGLQSFKYPEVFSLINEGGIELNKMIKKHITLEEVVTELPDLNAKSGPGITMITEF